MADLILEPYALKQHWQPSGAVPDWRTFLSEYLLALAEACQAAGSPVIGHIKSLTLFPDGGYFRASVVDCHLPPTMEGELPLDLPSLDLTLNLIVYGLERQVLQELTEETAQLFAKKWRIEVTRKT